MQRILVILLIGSVALNLVAIWGFFHYIKYGGSPLGELKRRLTGTVRQAPPAIPFAEDNAKLAAAGYDSLRVVFLGASITGRWDLNKYFPEIHPVNRGAGGQTLPGIMARFKRDVIDIKPRAAVIKFCSTNIRPQIPLSNLQDGMVMMAELAKANSITPILTTIIPAGKPEARIGDYNVADTLSKFNAWVREYAAKNSIPIIDFASAIGDADGFLPRDCSTDPVHVNEKGYEILTQAAKPVIYQVLGLK